MHFYLVTTYKHAHYFQEMLGSIRQQYRTTEEFYATARIFVLDDASPDNTGQIIREAARTHSNVKAYVNAKNKGIGFNRNFLLNLLSFEGITNDDFVLFVDGDDILPVGSLAAKLDAFSADSTLQVVGGQLCVFYGNDLENVSMIDSFPLNPTIEAIASLFECHFYISNALFRASVFQAPTVRFPEIPTSEDWLFFTLHPLRKRHIQDVTLYYRRHGNNLTGTSSGSREVFSSGVKTISPYRFQVRSMVLLHIAMLPSVRDCELLDLVGYLTFRMKWVGDSYIRCEAVSMPWFSPLNALYDITTYWPVIRAEITNLFDRILDHNDRIPAFDDVKLRAYLAAVLEMAQQEVDTLAIAESAFEPDLAT